MGSNKFRILAIIFGVALIGLFEVSLRVFGVAEESKDDPFVGFTKIGRLFVEENGKYVTAPTRRHLFNYQSFDKVKGKNVKRIFCLGGSEVQGFPFGEGKP